MGMPQVRGGSAQGHPVGSVQWTFPQRGVRRGHVGQGPTRARRDCRDPPIGLVGRIALASVGDRRGQPAIQAGETKVSRTARRTDNVDLPRSQEADPTRSASRHPGGTANGSPQTERESEPASSAVAANARVRRRPGTRRAATAPMITTPAPTCVRCGREIQCRSSCVSGTMPVSTARATRVRLEGLGARAAEEGT